MADADKKFINFKPFHEMYRFTAFSMCIGLVYPNPATDKWRLLAIPVALSTIVPASFLILCDVVALWNAGNLLEVLRHFAMSLPFFMGLMKMAGMYYKRVEGREILDIINQDYATYNHVADRYKIILKEHITDTKFLLLVWNSIVVCIAFIFDGTATVKNIINIFMSEPKNYMIYDINVPNREPEARFESPYFEIMYFYCILVTVIYVINYTGYDGLMIVSVNHACLRLGVFNQRVEAAMLLKGEQLRREMSAAVQDQIQAMKLIELIQATFNVYLGFMYVMTLTEMVICLYLVNEGFEFDFQFTCVCVCTVVHVYMPCMIADRLKCKCEDSAVDLYCCGWERMYDLRVRNCVPFMIARAQCPVALKAFGILTYEMDLFVRTMKTAYSMYTLLKTQQI